MTNIKIIEHDYNTYIKVNVNRHIIKKKAPWGIIFQKIIMNHCEHNKLL